VPLVSGTLDELEHDRIIVAPPVCDERSRRLERVFDDDTPGPRSIIEPLREGSRLAGKHSVMTSTYL
jgi:hypothetical protein